MRIEQYAKWHKAIDNNPFPPELLSLKKTFFKELEEISGEKAWEGFPRKLKKNRLFSLKLFDRALKDSLLSLGKKPGKDFHLRLNLAGSLLFYSKLLVLRERGISPRARVEFDRFFNELLIRIHLRFYEEGWTANERLMKDLRREIALYGEYLGSL